MDTNIKLQESAKKQNKTIQQQQENLEEQGRQLSVNQDIITELEAENQFLSSELDSMKLNLNNLEQYGRRNSLRFNNLTIDCSQTKEDMINEEVHFVHNNMLLNGEKSLIEKSKGAILLEEKSEGRKQQIIVKFSNYKITSKMLANKTKLKGHSDSTFINEDLTTLNHGVVKSLLELRK